jgi:thiamine biosynthesis lipoprotein
VNSAISTSGGAMQWVEIDGLRYSHIVDPRTGLGATNPAQVTVVGPLDAAVDALGTALALTSDDREAAAIMAKFPGYRARIERDGSVAWIGAGEASRGG